MKHYIDLTKKKNDKPDNWLMAKKPWAGYNCASCETYLGDLNETQNNVTWGQYPYRELNEKAYRAGNGFSRMLQMVNVEKGKEDDTDRKELKMARNTVMTTAPSKEIIKLPTVQNDEHNRSADQFEIREDKMKPKM